MSGSFFHKFRNSVIQVHVLIKNTEWVFSVFLQSTRGRTWWEVTAHGQASMSFYPQLTRHPKAWCHVVNMRSNPASLTMTRSLTWPWTGTSTSRRTGMTKRGEGEGRSPSYIHSNSPLFQLILWEPQCTGWKPYFSSSSSLFFSSILLSSNAGLLKPTGTLEGGIALVFYPRIAYIYLYLIHPELPTWWSFLRLSVSTRSSVLLILSCMPSFIQHQWTVCTSD